ncbi:MAG: molecular chaperone DnaJ [Sulfurovum sp.]|nr:molecular chaperone DnaJ [Sulfurovum sp.]
MTIDYYEILEVSRDSTGVEIKKSYRKLAVRYHPDKNPNDKEAEDRFKLINEAYDILGKDEKRQIYDQYGKEGLERQGAGFHANNMDDIMDVFNSMFGGGFSGGFGGQGRQRDPSIKYALDFEVALDLPFNEAVFGIEKEITIDYKVPCDTCNGTGAKDGNMETCGYCEGRGQVVMRQGFMSFAQECPKCQGSGQSAKEQCSTCSAEGFIHKEQEIKFNIPAGVDTGNRLRVAGHGNENRQGQRGDLYVSFSVEEDEHFVRDGSDIYIVVPTFFTQCILGETITIPSLNGELELHLKSGTKDKEQFIFKGEGVTDVHSGRKGRLIAQIKMVLPSKINDEQRELLEKIQESYGVESSPHKNSFESAFERVKGWFSG